MSGRAVISIWRHDKLATSIVALFALVVLAVVGATTWWALDSQRTASVAAVSNRVWTGSGVLAAGVESAIARGDLTGARRLVAQAAVEWALLRCRVTLPDGGVLADADPAAINVRAVPAVWPTGPRPDEATPLSEGGAVRMARVIEVPGMGAARLELLVPESDPMWVGGRLEAGLLVIAAVSLLALLLAYVRARGRLRGIGAVYSALRAAAGGERSSAALAVGETLGPEAQAFNALLRSRDEVDERALLASISQRPAPEAQGLGAAGEAMWHGLLVVDGGLSIVEVNAAAAVLLGSDRAGLVGRPLAEVLPALGVEAVRSVVGGSGGPARATVDVPRRSPGEPQGEAGPGSAVTDVMRVGVRALPSSDGGAAARALVVIEDVTQQRIRDASRDEFVAQAAHELRTPLTNILLYAESLLEDQQRGAGDAARRAEAVNVINQEGRRLERLVADMLSVSEIEAGALRLRSDDVRLDQLFGDLRADFERQAAEKSITLVFDMPPKFPVIRGDRDKLVLTAQNLLGNALKYTPAGGSVTVKLDIEHPGTPEQQVRVDIGDTGIGIKPEEHELVFQKFYRASDERVAGITGTGLGLALARQVARMHRGDITLSSELNKGSTFTLRLPAAA